MSAEWPLRALGELTVNHDGRRRPVKESERRAGRYPYYGASGVVDHVDGYLFDGEYLLVGEDGENLRTKQTPIAFLATGKFWVNNHAHIVAGNECATTKYLLYALLGSDISSHLTGAVMPKLTQGNLNRILVPCPPRQIQAAIVSVLGALDDRIALLRETSATLEAIAQALFKSWFVDFDPVRAKQQGLAPAGTDEATAALFPDGFAGSALGPIPKGWRIESLSSICESIFSGGTPDTRNPDYWSGDLRWFSSGETRDAVVVNTEKRINELAVRNSSTRLAKPGDVLIASAGQGATRGQTSYCAIDTYINQSVVAVRTDPRAGHPAWTYLNLARRYAEMRALSDSHSIRGSLTTKTLASMKLILPSVALVRSFGDLVGPLLAAQAENRRRSATLSKLRDTLLPRLISGQLRLPEAEAMSD